MVRGTGPRWQYDPLFTTCDPKFEDDLQDPQASVPGFYYPIRPIGDPMLPSWHGLPDITANRLDRRHTLLEQIDRRMSQLDASLATERMTYYKREAFNLLTSGKTRQAFDLSRESPQLREQYGRNLFGSCALTARRLVEAGVKFVGISTESKYPDGGTAVGGGPWESHDKHGAYPIDRSVSSGDHVATIYRLLGIDPRMTIDDLAGRPVPISHGGQPVSEIIA